MQSFTVQQLAKKAGVTPRTLRFYDKAGLLSPESVGKNGYRYYGEKELIRLQQILFFRELDFPLDDIKKMLDHPRFDVVESLRYQKELIQLKKKRLEKIIHSIEKTIITMQNNQNVTDQDMYGSLSQETIDAYKKEARERWGDTDAYKESQRRVAQFTKDDWARIKSETDANLKALVDLMLAGKEPASPEVQAEIAKHHAGIERFYPCSPTMYRGLGEMYLADQRFADTYRQYHKDLPEFLVRGIHAFCDRVG